MDCSVSDRIFQTCCLIVICNLKLVTDIDHPSLSPSHWIIRLMVCKPLGWSTWEGLYTSMACHLAFCFPLFSIDSVGKVNNICIVQYTFRFGEHDVKISTHGNSRRRSEPYVRTQPSTLQKIKEEQACASSTPKSVVAKITESEGGITQCRSSSNLPRNRKQVTNVRQQSYSKAPNQDLLYAVMEMCLKAKSGEERFVRSVQAAPEPMAVLALDQQLIDLERFCTDEDEFCVAGFDPTFNCGKFAVTVMVYKNLLIQNCRDGSIPTFLGPILVHQRKLKESYHYLLSTIIGQRPSLSRIRAIGTDGETNLFNAILNNLPFAQHVRCAVHMARDLQRKMTEAGVPKKYHALFLKDIMGSFYIPDSVGLVDAESEEAFDEMLSSFGPVWDKREAEFSSQPPRMYAWFRTYHAKDVRSSMIRPVRERVGLGDPPAHFTTNSNESMNKVIKQALHYEEKNWDKFCDDMLSLVKLQYQELEKAVVRTGEYRFRPQFAHLEVPLSKWNRMSVPQRKQHVKRVMCATIHPTLTTDLCNSDGCVSAEPVHVGAFPTAAFPAPTNVPRDLWDRCVAKAHAIVAESVSMSSVPGGNCRSKFVAWSRNPESPIKVQAGKSIGTYTCSKTKCPVFAGYKICAHVMAVAIHNGDIETLLKRYGHVGKAPNLTDVAMVGMPKNAGKKPKGKKVQHRKKRSTPCNVSSLEIPGFSGGVTLPTPPLQPASEQVRPRCVSQAALPVLPPQPESGHPYDQEAENNRPSQGIQIPSKPSQRSGGFTHSQSHIPDYQSQSPSMSHYRPSPPPLVHFSGLNSPLTQIQNQHVVSGSHASMIVSQPSCSYSLSVFPGPRQQTSTFDCSTLPQSLIPEFSAKPFFVKFLTKQIKVCQGCRGGYQRSVDGSSLPAPYDIIVGHRDHQQFQDRVTGLTRFSKETCLHFHANPRCILLKYPTFNPTSLQIPPAVLERLCGIHKQYLDKTFGLHLV